MAEGGLTGISIDAVDTATDLTGQLGLWLMSCHDGRRRVGKLLLEQQFDGGAAKSVPGLDEF